MTTDQTTAAQTDALECIGLGCGFTTTSSAELQRHTIDHLEPDLEERPIIPNGGACSVHLQMDLTRAITPQDAVSQVIAEISTRGLTNLYWRVSAGDEDWMIKDDHVVTEDELSIRLGAGIRVDVHAAD